MLEARAQMAYAEVLQQGGQYVEAIPLARAAATTFSAAADAPRARLEVRASAVMAWYNLGGVLREARQFESGQTTLTQAVERGRANLKLDPAEPNARFVLAAALVEEGRLRQMAGRNEEARTSLDDAVTRLEKLVGEFPGAASFVRRLAEALIARGELCLDAKQTSAAAADARRSVALLEWLDQRSSGAAAYQPLLAFAYTLAGKVELKRNNVDLARAALDKAQQRMSKARAANPDGPLLVETAKEIESRLQEVGK